MLAFYNGLSMYLTFTKVQDEGVIYRSLYSKSFPATELISLLLRLLEKIWD
jgi:hypothetical protein